MKTAALATTLAFASVLVIPLFFTQSAHAASQDECAIWICLPGGFPNGCEAPHKAFLRRLRKGKSPLPSWGSCAVHHPEAPPVNARADFGTDPYIPCKDGYHLVSSSGSRRDQRALAQCVSNETRFSPFGGDVPVNSYPAVVRPNGGRFVTYTINGSVVYPTDEAGNKLADARFFY